MISVKLYFIGGLFISALTFVHGQYQDHDCEASAGPIDSCLQIISSNCEDATFIANRSAYSDQCSPMSLFWDAPTYNMTILFQSNLKKNYSLCMEPVACTQAYRTLDDGSEVPIKWNISSKEPNCFKNEHSDCSTTKFRFDAGTQWHCYGTFINFFYRF